MGKEREEEEVRKRRTAVAAAGCIFSGAHVLDLLISFVYEWIPVTIAVKRPLFIKRGVAIVAPSSSSFS